MNTVDKIKKAREKAIATIIETCDLVEGMTEEYYLSKLNKYTEVIRLLVGWDEKDEDWEYILELLAFDENTAEKVIKEIDKRRSLI